MSTVVSGVRHLATSEWAAPVVCTGWSRTGHVSHRWPGGP